MAQIDELIGREGPGDPESAGAPAGPSVEPTAPTKEAVPGAAPPPGPPKKPKVPAAVRKRRRRIVRLVILGILLVVIAVLLIRRFAGGGDGGNDAVPLTDEVRYGAITSTVEGSGVTRARDSETLTVPFAGTVVEVLVEEGDEVSAGQPLYTIDSEDARKAVSDAEDGIKDAQDAVERARDGVQTARDRVTSAEESVQTARDRVQEAQDSVKTAQDNVASARERADNARKDLADIQKKSSDLNVRAAYDGKLLETVRLSPGDKVSEGQVLAKLAEGGRLRLTQYWSRAYAGELTEGQEVEVSIPALMSTVPGTVAAVHPEVSRPGEEGASYFSAEILVEDPGGLSEGMSATAVAQIDGETAYPYEPGKLEYWRTTEIKAEVSGAVIFSELLDYLTVSEGQILVRLSGEDLDKEIDDARKTVEAREKEVEDALKAVDDARARVTDAEKGVEDARKSVTEAEKGVEDAQKTVEDQLKGVQDAQDKLVKAMEELDKCDAVAPLSGKVIGLDLVPGEEVQAGKAAVTISDTSVIVVNATVDEMHISYVKKGMMVDLTQYDTMAMGTVESVSLSSTVTSGVASYPMVISVDNEDGAIQVNSSIQYSLVASQNDDCLIVPIQCVRSVSTEDGDSLSVVYVQADEPPEGAAEGVIAGEEIPDGFWPMPVEIGIQDSYDVEIRSGLEEGMVVFTQMQSGGIDFVMF